MSEIYRLSEARRSRKQRHMDRCRYHMQFNATQGWQHHSAHRTRWTAIFRAWLLGKEIASDCRVIDTKEAGE